ncbi:MAG: type IV pilus secretin PilQ [Elusimicrobiales bacterium]|nr:type IV pilus secretin PilQ [Elusimicrobiales bacterium]
MIRRIILIILMFKGFLICQESKTIITAIKFSENLLSIIYEGPKLKFQISKIDPQNIFIEIKECLVKTQKEHTPSSTIFEKVIIDDAKDIIKINVKTKYPVEYSVFEGDKVVSIKLVKVENVSTSEMVKTILPKKAPFTKNESKNIDILDNLPKYKIDLEYPDISVKTVILQMMQRANINVIFDNDVAGNISVSLKNIPFDEAFKTILDMKGLVAQQVSDNVIKISTPKKILDSQKNSVLQTRIFFLNYVKASDLKAQIESIAQAEGRTTSKCNIDETNNALIVTDTLYGLESIEKLIKKLDRMPKQVLIEAKLVEVSLDSGLHTGVQWGVVYGRDTTQIGMGNLQNVVKDLSGNPIYALPIYSGGGTGVSLIPEQGYGSFRFLKVTSKTVLDATLSAATRKGKANILSNPKIATLNNKEASINITNQIPYVTTEITNTSGGSVSSQKITYITAGIVLNVLPTITSDGRIIMKISPKVSKPSQTAQFQPPSIDERTADTTVVVDDGETIVIGGLIHDSESDYIYKVPFFGDIPILGYLFKKKSKEKSRMELLIFVTPKILE